MVGAFVRRRYPSPERLARAIGEGVAEHVSALGNCVPRTLGKGSCQEFTKAHSKGNAGRIGALGISIPRTRGEGDCR
jgi:hypothetical protein